MSPDVNCRCICSVDSRRHRMCPRNRWRCIRCQQILPSAEKIHGHVGSMGVCQGDSHREEEGEERGGKKVQECRWLCR